MLHESLSIVVDLRTGGVAVTADPDVRPAAIAWARERKSDLLAIASAKAGGNGKVRLTAVDLASLARAGTLFADDAPAPAPAPEPPATGSRADHAWQEAVVDALTTPLRTEFPGVSTLAVDGAVSAVRTADWSVVVAAARADYPDPADAAAALIEALRSLPGDILAPPEPPAPPEPEPTLEPPPEPEPPRAAPQAADNYGGVQWEYVIKMLRNQPDDWEKCLRVHAAIRRTDYSEMISEAMRRIEAGGL